MLIRAWHFSDRNSNISTCCNQMIQQYSPFIIYAMWLMFSKMAEICVAILDDWLFFLCFYCNIYL